MLVSEALMQLLKALHPGGLSPNILVSADVGGGGHQSKSKRNFADVISREDVTIMNFGYKWKGICVNYI